MFPSRVQWERDHSVVNGAVRGLAPGMAVTAEVKTGRTGALARPPCVTEHIDFLLSPLAKRVEEAGRER